MRDAQIMGLRSVAIVDLIKLCAAIVFGARALIAPGGIERRCRGHEGNPGFAERLSQGLERRIDIMRPAIGGGVSDRLIIFARARHIGDRRVVVGREAGLLLGRCGHVLRSHMHAIILENS